MKNYTPLRIMTVKRHEQRVNALFVGIVAILMVTYLIVYFW